MDQSERTYKIGYQPMRSGIGSAAYQMFTEDVDLAKAAAVEAITDERKNQTIGGTNGTWRAVRATRNDHDYLGSGNGSVTVSLKWTKNS